MARTFADIPPAVSVSAEDEQQQGTQGRGLSLELQLWVEVLLLIVLGLVMIYSASSVMALKKLGDSTYYVKRQLLCVVLGLGGLFCAKYFPYKRYKVIAPLLLVGTYAALILVLIPGVGVELNHARRWFRIVSFSVQPAEYAKVVWMIYLCAFLDRKQEKIKKFSIGLLPPIVLCGIFGILLLLEPDFGTSFVIGVLTISMLAVGGVRGAHLASLVPCVLAVLYKFVYRSHYRWERITAFLNPWTDPLDSGYQLIQAWIAVGSGGLLGKGLGAGQQKLFYLPEPYTDFIMAVIGEELGFVGILFVSIVFVAIAWTGFQISHSAQDYFGSLLAMGLTLMVSIQALINICVVLGLFPTKGLPLPFVSYGGSSFIANCLAVGILMNIARQGVR